LRLALEATALTERGIITHFSTTKGLTMLDLNR
jgi:hypothetical protein